ncbi:MAG: sensor domain-containing diguanylate cyclase [Anaerotignaceae bacterium]
MANDSFVENWLKEEQEDDFSIEHQKKMTEYLEGLMVKYDYNSVFLVSENSKNYYHFKGINKVISENDEHDKWYYDFVESNLTYDLIVDTDEANSNNLSVFINCRIDDNEGNFLGVTGVGLQLDRVQELLTEFGNDFQLEAMLFDNNGIVQVHTDTGLIGKKNIFNYKSLEENKDIILDNKETISVYQYKDNRSSGYIIIKYIEDLNWYLLVKKDTSVLANSFHTLLANDSIIFFVVLFFIIFIISKIIENNHKVLLTMAKTDILTGLPNRRGFEEAVKKIIENTNSNTNCYIFVFDIDNFKNVNDMFGHIVGDEVIYNIGKSVQGCLEKNGKVFRWGGDEFVGYIIGDQEVMEEMVGEIYNSILTDKEFQKYKTTISTGITLLQNTDTVEIILKRADKALYVAKENGKNKYTIY